MRDNVTLDSDYVAHILDEQWKRNYFLSCRVDFLVCDRDGFPLAAYEYDGSHHHDEQRAEKDRLKDQILAEVGVPVTRCTAADLLIGSESNRLLPSVPPQPLNTNPARLVFQ
jgi:very-short-patch-repair endonuclease